MNDNANENLLSTLPRIYWILRVHNAFLSGLEHTRVIHKLLPHRIEPCKKPCVQIIFVLLMEFNPNPNHTAVHSAALSYAHAPY